MGRLIALDLKINGFSYRVRMNTNKHARHKIDDSAAIVTYISMTIEYRSHTLAVIEG